MTPAAVGGRRSWVGSPALALSWQLWRRGAGPAVGLALYGSLLALLAHLPGAAAWRPALIAATMPLGLGLLFFLATFTFPEADLQARQSGYPAWMLVLPARTGSLAFWPMFHGTVAAALAWLLPIHGILAPLGVPAESWPAALVAALLAGLQALVWTPFGLPYPRTVLALLLGAGLVTAGVASALQGASGEALAAAFTSMVGVAYAGAVVGLTRARRGEVGEWVGRRPDRAARVLRPFASPLQAQIWHDGSASGKMLPLLTAVLGALFSLPFLWVREVTPLVAGAAPGTGGAIAVNLWLKMLAPCLFALPLLAAIVGCGRARWEGFSRQLGIPWFLAVRPLDDAALVAARFAMAARGALTAWGIAGLLLSFWLLLPAEDGSRRGPLLFLILPHLTARLALAGLVALALLLLWTWKNQAQALWADASGRPLLVHGAPIASHGAALACLVWVAERGGPLAATGRVPLVVWAGLGVALGMKLLAAFLALRMALQRRQIAPRTLECLGAAWLLTALTLGAALSTVARLQPQPGSLEELLVLTYLPILHPTVLPAAYRESPFLIIAALVFLPLARLALAPLMVGWNRRR